MLLDVKPLHDKNRNCLEDVLVSLTTWLDIEHVLMYSEAWNFIIYPSMSGLPNTLGNRIDAGWDKNWRPLEKYHGIKVTWQYLKDCNDIFERIEHNLITNHPVIVHIDSYFLPWAKAYMKLHIPHYCLVIGFAEDLSNFMCIDPYINEEVNFLSKEILINGKAKLITFSVNNENVISLNGQEVIKTIVQKALAKHRSKTSSDLIRIFADEIKNSLDLKKEVNGNQFLFLVPFYMQLHNISSSRLNVSKVFEYLGNHFDEDKYKIYAEKMRTFYEDWREVKRALIDAYGKKTEKATIIECAYKINNIAYKEERFSQELI